MSDFEKIREQARRDVDEFFKKTIESFSKLLDEMKEQGIDLDDKEQVKKFFALKQIEWLQEIHDIAASRIQEKQDYHRQVQKLRETRKELFALIESCSSFPSKIRILLKKKEILLLCDTIRKTEYNMNLPLYADPWVYAQEIIELQKLRSD